MPEYREKLWAAPWVFVATALVIPASILVLAPISLPAGIVTAVVLYGGCVLLFTIGSPTVRVSDGVLTAGQASVQTKFLGEAEAFEGAEATMERGTRLDVRAWLLIRGWVSPVVRIPVLDPGDPTPYWLLSSRRPHKLAAAINGSRRPVSED
ncbi:DUF3093 domain-containing protein [Glaciibacter superstes]|uniref:DUF3093 domain-containing protein n=1 Tax=Glaciibacter superstes TaxID=501023 RepID=UPI0003B4EC99|nr:DUF3093 domain-containing protein [Glaciibacter superstes]